MWAAKSPFLGPRRRSSSSILGFVDVVALLFVEVGQRLGELREEAPLEAVHHEVALVPADRLVDVLVLHLAVASPVGVDEAAVVLDLGPDAAVVLDVDRDEGGDRGAREEHAQRTAEERAQQDRDGRGPGGAGQ